MLNRILTATALAGICATSAAAKDIRVATGFPPKSALAQAADGYAEVLKDVSEGDLNPKVYHMSLLSLAETAGGIRDGIADVGYVLTGYFPSEFPNFNMIAELSMISPGPEGATNHALAYTAAVSEYTFQHCPECQADFSAQNQVFTGSGTSTSYGLLCTQDIASVEDLAGKRLRVSGSQWARWASAMGASSVSLPINEVYEALSQGVIDCVVASPPELVNFSLIDVVSHVNMNGPGGVYAAAAISNVNKDTWLSLSDKQRSDMLRAAASLSADATWRYMVDDTRAMDEVREKGIAIAAADPAMVEATKAFVAEDTAVIATQYKDKFGIENAPEKIASFNEVVDKWFALTKDINSSEEYADLLWEEIFSKVDVTTHGH